MFYQCWMPRLLRLTWISRLHPLKGELKGLWPVTVSGNWRVTFRIENGNVFDVDLTDYH